MSAIIMPEAHVPFPDANLAWEPTGNNILFQIERPDPYAGSLRLIRSTDEGRDIDQAIMLSAKVVAMGKACYLDLKTGEQWAGGAWCQVGDVVRIPGYGGDRWKQMHTDGKPILFALMTCNYVSAKRPVVSNG